MPESQYNLNTDPFPHLGWAKAYFALSDKEGKKQLNLIGDTTWPDGPQGAKMGR